MQIKYELKYNNDINKISSASCAGNYIVRITNFRDSHVTWAFNLWVDSQTAVATVKTPINGDNFWLENEEMW